VKNWAARVEIKEKFVFVWREREIRKKWEEDQSRWALAALWNISTARAFLWPARFDFGRALPSNFGSRCLLTALHKNNVNGPLWSGSFKFTKWSVITLKTLKLNSLYVFELEIFEQNSFICIKHRLLEISLISANREGAKSGLGLAPLLKSVYVPLCLVNCGKIRTLLQLKELWECSFSLTGGAAIEFARRRGVRKSEGMNGGGGGGARRCCPRTTPPRNYTQVQCTRGAQVHSLTSLSVGKTHERPPLALINEMRFGL
jgi:hypothetical protein